MSRLECDKAEHVYCVKSVLIRSFSGPYFPAFGLNTDQKNSEYGHFSRSGYMALSQFFQKKFRFKQFWKPVIISLFSLPKSSA